ALAEPEGYIRLFLDEGPALLSLLRLARARGLSPDYLTRLLTAQGLASPAAVSQSAAASAGLVEPLTARELEVLRLLATGAANEGMAERVVIAVSTVKRHVSNLLAKLAVSNRTQAVTRAQALELL